jgi:hypothetical protein
VGEGQFVNTIVIILKCREAAMGAGTAQTGYGHADGKRSPALFGTDRRRRIAVMPGGYRPNFCDQLFAAKCGKQTALPDHFGDARFAATV